MSSRQFQFMATDGHVYFLITKVGDGITQFRWELADQEEQPPSLDDQPGDES